MRRFVPTNGRRNIPDVLLIRFPKLGTSNNRRKPTYRTYHAYNRACEHYYLKYDYLLFTARHHHGNRAPPRCHATTLVTAVTLPRVTRAPFFLGGPRIFVGLSRLRGEAA